MAPDRRDYQNRRPSEGRDYQNRQASSRRSARASSQRPAQQRPAGRGQTYDRGSVHQRSAQRPGAERHPLPPDAKPARTVRNQNILKALLALAALIIVVVLIAAVIVPAVQNSSGGSEEQAATTEAATDAGSGEAADGEADDEEAADETAGDEGSAEGGGDEAASGQVSSVSGTSVEERLSACSSWDSQSSEDFSNISEAEGVYSFDLSDASNTASEDAVDEEALQTTSDSDELPQLSISSIVELACAMAPYERAEVPYGFLVMDIQTGRGFAFNLDEEVYGASSFKAPFCTFVAQNYIDTGDYSLDSSISSTASTDSGGYSYSGTATLASLFENAIVYSSNEALVSLRLSFDDSSLAAWLDELGCDSEIAYDTSFPHYTTRDAARLWLTIYQYFDADSEAAALIEESCGSTETSFLRDALSDLDGVTVRDKAGWNSDGDSTDGVDYNAIVDNGIVTCNDRDYLVCVMTGASYSESTVPNAETLMAAVFAAHEDLA